MEYSSRNDIKVNAQQLKSALGDQKIAEPIMMLIKNRYVNPSSYTSEDIANSLLRCLNEESAFYQAILYFELNYYELYLALEGRLLPLKQFYFRATDKITTPEKKKKFRNTRIGRIMLHLPVASFLYYYLRFIAHLPNSVIAFLTSLAIPFCSKAMRNRLKKSIIYMRTDDPLVQWFKRIFNKDVIDANIAKYFVKNILGRWLFLHEEIEVPAPYFISISPSTECNLHCIGCYAAEYENSSLSKEQVNNLLSQALCIGTQIVCFTGGEPFLYPHFFDVIKSNKELFFLVFTNGTHIDEDACKKIKSLGNVAILMSIEGNEAETDLRRGQGVYAEILAASHLLKKHRILFGYSIMAASNNGDTLADSEFYKSLYEYGAMILWLTTYLPIGSDKHLELLPSPKQRFTLKQTLMNLRHTMPMFIVDFENDSSYVGGCTAAGRRLIHVNSKGQYEPCNYFHYFQHTIDEVPISKAITSSFFQIVREHQPFGNCGYTPCLFDCNVDELNSILSAGRCKPSYTDSSPIWNDEEFVKAAGEYRHAIKELYMQNAIDAFSKGENDE